MTALAALGIALALILLFDLMVLNIGADTRPDFGDAHGMSRTPSWF